MPQAPTTPFEPRPISVWRYSEAPPELRFLVPFCGNEAWLIIAPPTFSLNCVPWIRKGFGTSRVEVYPQPSGDTLYIATK